MLTQTLNERQTKIQTPSARSGNLIELRQVAKTFENAAGTFTALKGVDLQVRSGELVAIVGKSGSGKSTLLNVLSGIDRPTSGEILIGGTAVHTLTEGQIAAWRGRNVGVVFQFFQLLPTLTAIENVILPMDFCNAIPGRERQARAEQLLEMVSVADQADKLPNTLSGGQQQRVAIARALANDPAIILADEPTGNLDSRTADDVFRLFQNLTANGKTVLVVSHERDIARLVNRTVTIADGKIMCELRN
ncbi:MAG: ABC transporter ATP-binding protein [Chloroflexi bacterium]|nr:ABC transporter ATP-binding protein [Chloroflexota bacterium]